MRWLAHVLSPRQLPFHAGLSIVALLQIGTILWFQDEREPPEEPLLSQLQMAPQITIALDGRDARANWENYRKLRESQLEKVPEKNLPGASKIWLEWVTKDKPQLAGLPFIGSSQCYLTKEQTTSLENTSFAVRSALSAERTGEFATSQLVGPSLPTRAPDLLSRSWFDLGKKAWLAPVHDAQHVSGLVQILEGEEIPLRKRLLEILQDVWRPDASRAIARRAIFDIDPDVRHLAQVLLKSRPLSEIASVLLEGLSYPMVHVAREASTTLVQLDAKALVPALIALLDAPDPAAPFKWSGDKGYLVRETVCVNHLRSCLLCHPPASRGGGVFGIVPDPMKPLSASASVMNDLASKLRRELPKERLPKVVGYGEGPRQPNESLKKDPSKSILKPPLIIRADITLLRQDFSVMLPVANPGPWPQMQRFDFLVRTRPATPEELRTWRRNLLRQSSVPSPHRQAVLDALRGLTGRDEGLSAEQWRAALGLAR